MELTKEQFSKIKHIMPVPRKKPTITNDDLYIIEKLLRTALILF